MKFHTKAITEAIITRFPYNIIEVNAIEDLGIFAYHEENIQALTSLIKYGNYDEIGSLEKAKDVLGEELNLIRFKDQDGKLYYAFYYDSIEMGQNPFVMEVFPGR